MSGILADAVLVAHLAFIVFVVAGGVLVLRRPALALLHLPAVAWAVYVEWSGTICPLTPLEVALRRRAGTAGYEGGFIEHYLMPLIYPPGLTASTQLAIGAAVLAGNVLVYAAVLVRRRRACGAPTRSSARPAR